jgi:PAS domain S-box-containing protein
MSLNDLIRWQSLKTRVTLLSLAVFVIGLWVLAFYGSRVLRDEMEAMLGDQQFSAVSALAVEIDHALDDRLNALDSVAATIGPVVLGNATVLQTLLEHRPVLRNFFNGGVVAHRLDGTAVAEVPLGAGRIGVNYMNIDAVAAALKEGRSTIGEPVMGKKLQAPVFGMVAPIRDAQGKVIGALSGVTNLGKPGFLDKIARSHYGKSGGYMLVDRRQRLVIAATDERLRMATLPAPGVVSLVDRFVQGYEGTGIAVNPLGVEVLGSARGVPAADWYVAVALPVKEAFAPIRAMQERMLLAAILLTVLVGVLTRWILQRQLSPLLDAVTALGTLPDRDQAPLPLPVARQDEIGELIGGFNRLLETLAKREATLRASEECYRSFFEASPDAILVHQHDIVVFANDAAAHALQYGSAAMLIGRDWHELIVPEDWPITEKRVASLMRGETSQVPPLERRHLTFDGRIVSLEGTGALVIFGGQPAVLMVVRDITLRKATEAQRLADARQQRDALVREVHHRIKNNLQSVAGLLQRELGKFVELDPRLETAISQVRAIAVVHGLQSSNPDEAVRLCDSVRNICKTVAELSQRPVEFDIEGEQTIFRPVRIENDEAVPVALVLNELILNAVKHSPEDSPAPTVSLNADGSSARIVIRNAVRGGPGFDIDTGRGLGTGLRLVRSLLPDHGAQLQHQLDATGVMLTTLKLTHPVVGRILDNTLD